MGVNLIFKIAAVGILVSVMCQVLKHSGREDQAFLTSLAGLILVLFWIVPYIYELFETIKNIWNSKRIIKKIDTIIDDDNKSVKLIRDYLEYSRCVSDEKHTVLKELVTDGGKLHDNSFAKLIIEYDVNYAVNELNHRLDLLEKNQDVVREI